MVKGFDVVISGAGPAGSAAAAVLAGRGLSVALVDRAAPPRPKLCGGLLTAKSMDALARIFGLAETALAHSGGLFHKTPDYLFLHENRPLLSGAAAEPFRFVDRPAFDALLVDTAIRRGAAFFPGTTATGCDPATGLLSTSLGDFQGRFLIGADGANSVLRRSLTAAGLAPKAAWQYNLAAAIEVELPVGVGPGRFPREVHAPELHVGQPEAGYGWVFPGPRGPKVGICGLARVQGPGGDFGTVFRRYLALLGVPEPQAVPLHGHPLPYGNSLGTPCLGRLLLAGDAGGFVEPLFGEGIFYALCTGAHAASAILAALDSNQAPATAHAEYQRLLDATVRPELLWSDRLRWMLFRALKHLGPSPIRLFVTSAPASLAEMVHGHRSFMLLARKRWIWGRGVAA